VVGGDDLGRDPAGGPIGRDPLAGGEEGVAGAEGRLGHGPPGGAGDRRGGGRPGPPGQRPAQGLDQPVDRLAVVADGQQGLDSGVEAVEVDEPAVDGVQQRPLGEGGQGLVAAQHDQVGAGGDGAVGQGRGEGEVCPPGLVAQQGRPVPVGDPGDRGHVRATPR